MTGLLLMLPMMVWAVSIEFVYKWSEGAYQDQKDDRDDKEQARQDNPVSPCLGGFLDVYIRRICRRERPLRSITLHSMFRSNHSTRPLLLLVLSSRSQRAKGGKSHGCQWLSKPKQWMTVRNEMVSQIGTDEHGTEEVGVYQQRKKTTSRRHHHQAFWLGCWPRLTRRPDRPGLASLQAPSERRFETCPPLMLRGGVDV